MKTRDIVIAYVGEHPGVTSAELVSVLGLSRSSVHRHTKACVEMGIIDRTRGIQADHFTISEGARP